jgi:hypothetical protein
MPPPWFTDAIAYAQKHWIATSAGGTGLVSIPFWKPYIDKFVGEWLWPHAKARWKMRSRLAVTMGSQEGDLSGTIRYASLAIENHLRHHLKAVNATLEFAYGTKPPFELAGRFTEMGSSGLTESISIRKGCSAQLVFVIWESGHADHRYPLTTESLILDADLECPEEWSCTVHLNVDGKEKKKKIAIVNSGRLGLRVTPVNWWPWNWMQNG